MADRCPRQCIKTELALRTVMLLTVTMTAVISWRLTFDKCRPLQLVETTNYAKNATEAEARSKSEASAEEAKPSTDWPALSAKICSNLSNVYNVSEAYNGVDDWQTVVDGVLIAYSAHVDPRENDFSSIRIFGIMSQSEFDKPNAIYYCQLYVEGTDTVYVVESEKFGVGEHKQPKFRMVELACQLAGSPWSLPRLLVSVTTEPCAESENRFVVRQNYKNGFTTNFTLCLDGVLKHGTAGSSLLVEWIELNVLLGAEHVYVYNMSGSALLDPYLSHYERNGLLTVLPWNLPLLFNEELDEVKNDFYIVWNYAQVTAENDCLYRNLFAARHLVYLDFDEFVLPQMTELWTWQEMLERVEKDCPRNVGSYLARHVFFPLKLVNASNVDEFNLTTAIHTTMTRKLNKPSFRSKYIIIPERVRHVNIHYVEEYSNVSYETCVLTPSVGFLHHYREVDRFGRVQENMSALKYRTHLVNRIKNVYEEIKTSRGSSQPSLSDTHTHT